MISLSLEVKDVQPSKLEGVKIAKAEGQNETVTFDVIESIYTVSSGDKIEMVIDEDKPNDLDSFEFCGHGYLAADESKGFTLLSLWGILFKFAPPLGLKADTKYYLCMRRVKG